jgi:hypothetical protein
MIGLIVINNNLLNFRKNYEVNNYWLMIINNYQAYWWCIDDVLMENSPSFTSW